MEHLLETMHDIEASDLIVTAGTRPQYRVHGALTGAPDGVVLQPRDTQALAYSLMSERQIHAFEQDKSIDFSTGVAGASRYRVNVYFQRGAVAMAIRVIPLSIPSFEDLGLPDVLLDFAMERRGLVLVTGPAGSGKSTTLACMIDYINHHRHAHVICIEDPIEYLHQHAQSTIEQREIGEDANTFQDALRSVFRQSPDVIMVGEIRDLETMQLALTLAETGHLILGTLHTQDATHAIHRIVDAFPAHQQAQIYIQLSMVLVGVVAQQLLVTRDKDRRVLACEVLRVNNAIRNLIRERRVQQVYSVLQSGKEWGMVTMTESLKKLVQEGLVNPELALKCATQPKELEQLLGLG
jgi:twitching motility protein PilT